MAHKLCHPQATVQEHIRNEIIARRLITYTKCNTLAENDLPVRFTFRNKEVCSKEEYSGRPKAEFEVAGVEKTTREDTLMIISLALEGWGVI